VYSPFGFPRLLIETCYELRHCRLEVFPLLSYRSWFLFRKLLAVTRDQLRCGSVQLDLIAYPLDFSVLVSDVRG
jgi:hypothetical protein